MSAPEPTSLTVDAADALPTMGLCCIGWYTIGQVHGIERGRVQRVEIEAERRAHEILHEGAVAMLGMAREHARAKGPAWVALIEEAS